MKMSNKVIKEKSKMQMGINTKQIFKYDTFSCLIFFSLKLMLNLVEVKYSSSHGLQLPDQYS